VEGHIPYPLIDPELAAEKFFMAETVLEAELLPR